MKSQKSVITIVVVLMVLASAISRVIIYPTSFSPVIALAIFSGAVIKDRKWAFILPLASIFLSDLLFEITKTAPGFWGWSQVIHYAIYALIVVIAFGFKKLTVANAIVYPLIGAVVFYLLSNTSVFLLENQTSPLYSQNFKGYIDCLVAGLPFFKSTFIATMCFSAVFFTAYYFAEKLTLQKAVA